MLADRNLGSKVATYLLGTLVAMRSAGTPRSPKPVISSVMLLANALGWDRASCRPQMVKETRGPGNVLLGYLLR